VHLVALEGVEEKAPLLALVALQVKVTQVAVAIRLALIIRLAVAVVLGLSV
jgi:hypothetical protein